MRVLREGTSGLVLHCLFGPGYNPVRFTGLIAQRVATLLDAEIRAVEGQRNSWHFQGVEAVGLIDDVFVLENTKTGAFKIVDFQDSDLITTALAPLSGFRGAAVMTYHPPTVQRVYGARSHLISPGWFTDQSPEVVRGYREQVAEIRRGPLDPRLFFRGTVDGVGNGQTYRADGRSVREVVVVLGEKYPDEVNTTGWKIPREEWLLDAARHALVLTLPGHPWCYREFEMMNLGIPILTYRWTSYLYHQPVHYVPVEGIEQHPMGFALDPERAADAIIERHRAVRDDRRLLDSLGRQAQAWYDRHWTPDRIAEDMVTFFDPPSLV